MKILQPGLKYSLLVGSSPNVEYGRVILVMDIGFCTDAAGNWFTRTANSSYFLHFDRRSVFVNLRTHVPEKLLQLNSETRTVEATNNEKYLKVYVYFSEPVLNSSAEILSVLRTSNGFLLPTSGKSLGNRRFGYLVKNISQIAVVTVSVETSSIISRQGTPVSPTEPVSFLYDSERPSVRLSTTSTMRTRECSVPVLIKFVKPVFDFNASAISISGGHLKSFHEVSRSIYTVDIHADGNALSVNVPENITGDVAGNRNLASNLLQVRHYSVPIISSVLSTFTTAAFAATSVAAALLTVSTASLQSLGMLSRPSLTSDPSRNLIRIACHIQVFALSKWLAVTMPVEYYEFVRGLQWSIPHLSLPWESGQVHSIMVDSTSPLTSRSGMFGKHELGTSKSSLSGTGKVEMDASLSGLPLTPVEYCSFFESQDMKPEADFIRDFQNSNRWNDFHRNIFWLAVIGGGLILLHLLILSILKFRRKDLEKQKIYGAIVFPRFEIFLIILALPCACQASAAIIRGGSTTGVIVGILLLGITSFLLLSLLLFLSIGITMGKLLQYKEVHQEGQKIHWYQDIVRVTLGPGKKGQWTWKNQPNSVYLTMLGPLFEDLRGPPKYMLSQIASGNPGKHGDRIIASDDETEDAEAPFIQKLFGILRIYYTLLESVKRVALGIVAGAYLVDSSSKFPTFVMLCITSFQLFFLVLKKPFIKKRVQFVEILSVATELGIFATCFVLLEKEFSAVGEKRVGIIMVLLFIIGFLAQMISEWHALYGQIMQLSPVKNSFFSGLKAASIGFLLILVPRKLLENWDEGFPSKIGDGETASSGDRNRSSDSRSSGERPWLKQLRELAKASFSRDDGGAVNDPSTSQTRSGFWSGKRSGSSSVTASADFKMRPRGLYKDLEAIFSSK
ncbi:uncharacterized protein LOC131234484 isoform X2 [Magnolia sinica]|nr:uncharacterized protein LOC131234484 isoform X2 [Magnolia sinica]XP_058087385.1 uncharacterized protein LOC131234484 isoform X2 [Magnolia sinica]XP_058087386.1 uncharacterized protein LOC131234484 isoform X2 [Magnolia sinica]